MVEERFIQTTYLKLAARAWGPKNGQPVLALHGWLDNAASFDGLAPLLPGCRIVALDLPGHGLSDWRPAGLHYHFVDFVPDVLQAAEALGWSCFTLLGHSLGASVACFTAAVAPERIERLALIEGLGPWSADGQQAPQQLIESMQQMQQLGAKKSPVYECIEDAAKVRQWAGDLNYAAALTLAKRGLKSVPGGFSWCSDPSLRLKSPIYLSEDQVLAFLRTIQAPTLLVKAQSGYLVQRAMMSRRFDSLPGLRVTSVAGGHHLHLDDPESVARVIAEFLGKI